MKSNLDKCHLLVSGHKLETVWAKIGGTKIWESNKQKLLDVIINRNLNFDEYVFHLCKKAGTKLSVLARLSNYIEFVELSNCRVLKKEKYCLKHLSNHKFRQHVFLQFHAKHYMVL